MARSDVFTLIPLDFWADVYGVDLYPFNQVYASETPECEPIWCQRPPGYGAQGRYHVRDSLARAIKRAESIMEEWLGSPVAPEWVMDEIELADCPTGRVRTRRYRVIEFGQPQWIKIGDYAPGYADHVAQVTVPEGDYDGDLCDLWIIAPDYPGDAVKQTYAIRPLRWAEDAAGDYIAEGHTAQFVDPDLWATCEELTDEAATYLNSVEVWQRTAGAGEDYPQAEIIWLPNGCGDEGICGEDIRTTCAHVRGGLDRRGGSADLYVVPATYNETTGVWEATSAPSGYYAKRVRLYYKAGLRPQNPLWCEPYDYFAAETVARLATAYLSHQPCGCEAVAQQFEHDRMWMAADGTPKSTPADPYAYRNPLGNTWAAQNAWKLIKSIRPNRVRQGGAV